MARNPNLIKSRRQKFRKHRGTFASRSEQSTLDKDFNDPKMRRFWAERVTPRSGGPTRSVIPLAYEGICDYRKRGSTPSEPTYLDTRYPGVESTSVEREAAQQRKREVREQGEEAMFIVVQRTRFEIVKLYFISNKDCWWLEKETRTITQVSITYGSKSRALQVLRVGQVSWKTTVPNSS
jgi:hypothetical protein